MAGRCGREGQIVLCDVVALDPSWAPGRSPTTPPDLDARRVPIRTRRCPSIGVVHGRPPRAGRSASRTPRSVRIPDLLIAAIEQQAGLPVVHFDEDYDRIAAITGQPTRSVAPRGGPGQGTARGSTRVTSPARRPSRLARSRRASDECSVPGQRLLLIGATDQRRSFRAPVRPFSTLAQLREVVDEVLRGRQSLRTLTPLDRAQLRHRPSEPAVADHASRAYQVRRRSKAVDASRIRLAPSPCAGPRPLPAPPVALRDRGRRLRNRIVSTPHATGWSRDGLIDRSEVDYHVRKAAGGCALVMTFGSASVDPTTEASYGSIALWDERNEPALRALADGVHAPRRRSCMSQMTHMGRRGTSAISGIPLRAPSDLPEGVHLEVPVPLAADELPAIVERFADVARRLERCGWDGVEVTSFGGHLIEQFFDPLVNTRTDAYGGSPREPHPVRPRGARGRARRRVRPLHRRLPDGGRPVPDRRPRPRRDDRDRAQPRVDRRGRPLQRQRRHRRDAPVDRLLRARRRAARGRLQRARAIRFRARSACRRSSPAATSSRRWPRRRWPAASTSSR